MHSHVRLVRSFARSLVRERIGLQHYPTTNVTKRLLWFGSGLPLPPRAHLAVSGAAIRASYRKHTG